MKKGNGCTEGDAKAVFVCVRDRAGKGSSCAGSGARLLLAEMRGALAAEGIGREELDVRPCGCLGLCKRGPVMLGVSGPAARAKKPAKPGKKRGLGVYTGVQRGELREILREVLRPE